MKPNYARRGMGALACLSPGLLLAASLLSRVAFPPAGHVVAAVLMGLGMAVAVLNFYLSFVRPAVYQARHGTQEGLGHVSAIPIAGTFLVVGGAVAGFGWMDTTLVGLAAVALDTGGSLWLLIWTWRDASFWDR